jgi:hypothetical protein
MQQTRQSPQGSDGFVFARKGEQLLSGNLRTKGRYTLLEESKRSE